MNSIIFLIALVSADPELAAHPIAPSETSPLVHSRILQMPQGEVITATGSASYQRMENAVATRVAQREARMAAFVEAQANLAKTLTGRSVSAGGSHMDTKKGLSLPDQEAVNTKRVTSESSSGKVEATLSGFILQAIQETDNTVQVTIATSPTLKMVRSRP